MFWNRRVEEYSNKIRGNGRSIKTGLIVQSFTRERSENNRSPVRHGAVCELHVVHSHIDIRI